MSYGAQEWLHLAFRWLHVVAAIYWLGQTALFAWLDTRLKLAVEEGEGKVFLVHSGGFYQVEKRAVGEVKPKRLQWFRWEAAITWLSGFALLTIVYYHGGLLRTPDSPTPLWLAITVGLGSLGVGWAVYDALCSFGILRTGPFAVVLAVVLIGATEWGLVQVLSPRAAFLHVGAVLGTIMTANVWMRILPGQRRIIQAVEAGKEPDLRLAAVAKDRSRHNTYLALPVVLIMIGNHFPVATYGNRLAWLVLVALVLVGFAARWGIERHEARA